MAPKKSKDVEFSTSRESLMASLTRNKAYISDNCMSMVSSELETRLSLVESVFTQLCSIQQQIENSSEDVSEFQTRQEIENLYCEVKSTILTQLAQRGRQVAVNASPSANSTLSVPSGSSRVSRLPKLKLPEFSGKVTEWTSWFNTFNTLIEADCDVDELSKFIHLRSCLGPSPLRTIECLELSSDNYRKALQLLKNRFENKAIIVQAHVHELFSLNRLKQPNSDSLRGLVDAVNSQLEALRSLSSDGEILEALLFHLVQNKLDEDSLEKCENEFDCSQLPSWKLLSLFITNRSIHLAGREVRKPGTFKTYNNAKRTTLTAAVDSNENSCYCCSGPHSIKVCPKFASLTPLQRYFEVKKQGLCFRCFSKRHQTKECNASLCTNCHKPHHNLLHRETINENARKSPGGGQANVASLQSALLTNRGSSFLATAVVLVKGADSRFYKCRCVLDSGSQINFVTAKFASQLKLQVSDVQYSLNGIGNLKSQVVGEVETTFKSRVTNFVASGKFSVLPEITQYHPTSTEVLRSLVPQKAKLADPSFDSAEEINMLLGVNLFFRLIVAGQIKMGLNNPVLQRSLLGWIVVGECIPDENVSLIVNKFEGPRQQEAAQLQEIVQRFWQCEEVSRPEKEFTDTERLCEDMFVATVKRTTDNRILVRLPFAQPQKPLGDSYNIALTRFLNLERKLNKHPELKVAYAEFIDEYRRLDHLEEVAADKIHEVKYVMPHHPVIRPESVTTKLRVVFDASCKSSNGLSLNDTMLVGPTLQSDLFETLTRFRFYRFALTADISKMYRQILVEPNDCNYLCILWRSCSTEQVKVLRLKTVTYGTNSAPFLAVRCLYYLADQFGKSYPLAREAVRHNFYMDDMLAGANSHDQLNQLKNEVTELLKLGRFELHKWRSNAYCGGDDDEAIEPLELQTSDTAKTLGIYWASRIDKFQFSYIASNSDSISKRIVLSELAQLFDPMGFLSPLLILGKIFMQELWLLKQHWDEELPPSYSLQWKKYRSELELVHECSLPRAVVPVHTAADRIELYGFSDASCRAYGAAVYVRVIDKQGGMSANLLTAKSKVAPVRVLSLPRLELEGAKLLAQLMAKIKKCAPGSFAKVSYFTDSTIVLSWIATHASRWSTFVANRVAIIQELSNVQEWYKIESKQNPADIVSRGLHASDLKGSSLWWQGPEFLQLPVEQWTLEKWERPESLPEQRCNKFSLLACSQIVPDDIIGGSKYAKDFLKLTRVFGYVYRWRKIVQKIDSTRARELSALELKGGLIYVVFNLQALSFSSETQKLLSGKIISSAKIQALNPFIDKSEGIEIIRVGGRLSQANVPFDTKHPMLLPNNHIVVNALFDYTHRSNMHVGAHALCAFVRQRFWVINARKLARRTVRSCIACFRQRPILAKQIMGSLPAGRVQQGVNPFERTGLDYAGPLWMHFNQRGRRPIKVYLCVFVCFLTKACHLELVSDLSTNAFVAALKRFFARRGISAELFCDNATNFVGASRELKAISELIWNDSGKHQIVDQCSHLGVNFHFIPPRSPHFGGLWESAVKIAKQLLIRSFNSAALNYEELVTAIAQAEAVMNSRPLHPLSSDSNDFEALTPGHFLIGRPLNCIPEPFDEHMLKLSATNRWKRIVAVQHAFWRRWALEYLTLLQERSKWSSVCNNIKEGVLVLIGEDNIPPGQWALGRIHQVHPGADGLVRVVTIKTKSGYYKRNIHKICPLPMDTEE